MTGEIHIEPRAASSCLNFLESMQGRYRAALRGAPILNHRAHQFISRNGVNAVAHGAETGSRTKARSK